MKIINESFEIKTNVFGMNALKYLETVGRVCYKSEDLITEESAAKFVTNLIKRKHFAMLEHISFSVKFIVDRGISHEMVRHRIASFAQESTRYCNYSKDKFGKEITVIDSSRHFYNAESFSVWLDACEYAEKAYFKLIELGETPQIARDLLPTCTKTEIWVTLNLREWRHFLDVRAIGTTGIPHPKMTEVTVPLLGQVKVLFPVIFDDLGRTNG
jgi:thymidylate synthase (FAD)